MSSMIVFKKLRTLAGITIFSILFAMMFLIPLLPLSVDKEVKYPLLAGVHTDYAIVFFGFTACSDTCPRTLSLLSQMFDRKASLEQVVTVIFIDIDQYSNNELAQDYANQFHPHFLGLQLGEQQLIQAKAEFGLNIVQEGEQIMHRGRTYLLSRQPVIPTSINAVQWQLVQGFNLTSSMPQQIEQQLEQRRSISTQKRVES